MRDFTFLLTIGALVGAALATRIAMLRAHLEDLPPAPQGH